VNGFIGTLVGMFKRIPLSLNALLARCVIGLVFWNSGRTKVAGWDLFHVTENTAFLFKEEYNVPFLAPQTAALLAQLSEHVFPVLLFVGFATRFSALALAGMTLVIQIFVYPNAYVVHGTWLAILLYLMKYGPGAISLDQLIASRGSTVSHHAFAR
jgi:putative oxidoreductase